MKNFIIEQLKYWKIYSKPSFFINNLWVYLFYSYLVFCPLSFGKIGLQSLFLFCLYIRQNKTVFTELLQPNWSVNYWWSTLLREVVCSSFIIHCMLWFQYRFPLNSVMGMCDLKMICCNCLFVFTWQQAVSACVRTCTQPELPTVERVDKGTWQ